MNFVDATDFLLVYSEAVGRLVARRAVGWIRMRVAFGGGVGEGELSARLAAERHRSVRVKWRVRRCDGRCIHCRNRTHMAPESGI